MDMWFLIGQAFGAVAFFFEIITFQLKTRHKILRAQVVANFLWLACYICLAAFTGIAMLILAIIRVVIFYVLPEKTSLKIRLGILLSLIAAAVVTLFFTWQNWSSLLAFGGWLTMTLALWCRRPQTERKYGVAQGLLWTAYDVSVLSIFGIASNLLSVVSAGIALWRYRGKKK